MTVSKAHRRPVGGTAVPPAPSTPALGAPAWTGASEIPESDTGGYARLVVAPDGTATAVWYQIRDGNRLRAAVKPPGGIFGSPIELASGTGLSGSPNAAVDDAGTVTVAWAQGVGDVPILRVSRKPAGGGFSVPEDVSDPGAMADMIEIDAAGTTTVVTWRQADRARAAIATGPGPFVMQTPVSKPGERIDFPEVAVAPSGAAVIAYRRYDFAGFTLRASARKPGQPFAPLADVLKTSSKDDVMHGARLVMSPSGRATLAWQRGVPTANGLKTYTLQSAARGTSGDFGPLAAVSSSGQRHDADFGLAVSADDTAVLVIPGPKNVRATFRPLGGGFGVLQPIPGSGPSRDADVEFTGGEKAIAIWHQFDGPDASITGAECPADAPFGAAHRVSPAGLKVVQHSHRSSLAVDDEGSAMAWWSREIPGSGDSGIPRWPMQVAAYDAVAPVFHEISVPASGRVGQSLPMTATARDRWSGATVNWEFGDGGSEEGETLVYAYAEPGTYTVRFTATDGAGNTRTDTRTIRITETTGPRP